MPKHPVDSQQELRLESSLSTKWQWLIVVNQSRFDRVIICICGILSNDLPDHVISLDSRSPPGVAHGIRVRPDLTIDDFDIRIVP